MDQSRVVNALRTASSTLQQVLQEMDSIETNQQPSTSMTTPIPRFPTQPIISSISTISNFSPISTTSPIPRFRPVSTTQTPVSQLPGFTPSMHGSQYRLQYPGLSAQTPRNDRAIARGRRQSFFARPNTQSTYTQKIYCLGRVSDITTGSPEYAEQLATANLGLRKTVRFMKNATHYEVVKKLEEEFPILKSQNGAIQLWKCVKGGNYNRPLHKIAPGMSGYSMDHIRNHVNSGTSTLYITPLQTDIIQIMVPPPEVAILEMEPSAPCNKCGEAIRFSVLMDHLSSCTGMLRETAALVEASTNVAIASTDDLEEGRQTRRSQLVDMFPHAKIDDINLALDQSESFDDAIERLLKGGDSDAVDQSIIETWAMSEDLEGLRSIYMAEFRLEEEFTFKLCRDNLWKESSKFYKKAMNNPKILQKKLLVEFSNFTEDGAVDAGAIKLEFFTELYQLILEKLFDSCDSGVIPKRIGMGKLVDYTVAGIVMAHSFLQGGPPFSRFQEWVIQFMQDPADSDLLKHFVTKNMMPLDASTANSHNLIDNLVLCTNTEQLNSLLDDPANSEILNATQWSVTDRITLINRELVVREIIFNEVIRKRREQLLSLRDGWKVVPGFMALFNRYGDKCAPVLCGYSHLSSKKFLLESFERIDQHEWCEQEKLVFTWLVKYTKMIEEDKADLFLQFLTGLRRIPAWGLDKGIGVKFLPPENNKALPEALSCFNILFLPKIHESEEVFFRKMSLGIECEYSGFSLEGEDEPQAPDV